MGKSYVYSLYQTSMITFTPNRNPLRLLCASLSCVHLFALIYEVTQNNFITTHLLAIISFIEQTFALPRTSHKSVGLGAGPAAIPYHTIQYNN